MLPGFNGALWDFLENERFIALKGFCDWADSLISALTTGPGVETWSINTF